MPNTMTPEAFWAHPRTRSEVESVKKRLRSIAAELGAEDATARLPRLTQLAHDLTRRLIMLELSVEEPPSEAPHGAARRVMSPSPAENKWILGTESSRCCCWRGGGVATWCSGVLRARAHASETHRSQSSHRGQNIRSGRGGHAVDCASDIQARLDHSQASRDGRPHSFSLLQPEFGC